LKAVYNPPITQLPLSFTELPNKVKDIDISHMTRDDFIGTVYGACSAVSIMRPTIAIYETVQLMNECKKELSGNINTDCVTEKLQIF
jgi:hypothetical protein